MKHLAPLLGYEQEWGGEQETGYSGAYLGASPARLGSKVASEGWGAPVYSSSRQRCRQRYRGQEPNGRAQEPARASLLIPTT